MSKLETMPSKKMENENPRLTPTELEEFRLRRVTLDQARNQLLMVGEAYQGWLARTLTTHGLRGKFTVNPADGAIMELPNG